MQHQKRRTENDRLRQRTHRIRQKIVPMLPKTPETCRKVKKRLVKSFESPISSISSDNRRRRTDLLCALLKIKGLKEKQSFDKMQIEILKLTADNSIVSLADDLGVNVKPLYTLFRTKAKSTCERNIVTETDRKDIESFVTRNDISAELPHQRHKGKFFMRMTMAAAHRKYLDQQEESGKRRLSMSSFNKHRPRALRLLKNMPDMGCQCLKCLNCALKMDSLVGHGIKGISKRISVNIFHTLCENIESCAHPICQNEENCTVPLTEREITDFRRRCAMRQCPHCCNKPIGSFFSEILEKNDGIDWEKKVSFRQWVKSPIGPNKKKKRVHPENVTVSLKKLLELFARNLKEQSTHLFNFVHQGKQYEEAKKQLIRGDVLMVCDFNTNYSHKQWKEPVSSLEQETVDNTQHRVFLPLSKSIVRSFGERRGPDYV